ncbi:MAG: V-type ATP synthase subunit A [Burkholderiales bacterium]|nr:V-type ATP synthase subunit A [Burkholderiales bacterium]
MTRTDRPQPDAQRARAGGASGQATTARITALSGPVLQALAQGAFRVGEAVEVGPARLPGEIIRLEGDRFTAQVYEDTTGLAPGDPVHGTGAALSVPLGPGLLGRIHDGLLRPLDGRPPPRWQMVPTVAPGERLQPAAVIARIADPNQGEGATRADHTVQLPPTLGGEVVDVAPAGPADATTTLLTLRDAAGRLHRVGPVHRWPVREPRPVAARLPADEPLLTGQRILDTLFPVARGGRAAIPGGFGTGKTVLQETLAKWCHADIIVYVGCGERGNEMAEVLHEFPALQDPRTGRALMERTVIIANASNMPVAAREASIYTAVTVAEYFRDQGLHVALMADSTSRWAEALREVSGRLGELPGEAGYPAYLGSRLAEFYERAARVTTLGGQEGSLTIIGAVSPPGGDFSEPVTSHTKRFVGSFWGLDRERAQARFYPAVHPLQSYAVDAARFAPWWTARGNADWARQRDELLALLEEQAHLERMARIVGRDALPPAQQLTLLAAELVDEALLRQSAFSPVDRYCSAARQSEMLRLVMRLIALARTAVERGALPQAVAALPVHRRLQRMGEEIGEDALARFAELWPQLEREFAALTPGPAAGTPTAAAADAVAAGVRARAADTAGRG